MRYFLAIIFFLGPYAFGQEFTNSEDTLLDGVWQLVESGCGLDLPEETINNLNSLGGESYEYMSILILYGQNYEKINYDGSFCEGKDIGFYYEGETRIICKGMATKSVGVFDILSNGELKFNGYPLNISPLGTAEMLGSQYKDVSYKFTESGVMIWEQELESHCGNSNSKYTSYFIRYHMS